MKKFFNFSCFLLIAFLVGFGLAAASSSSSGKDGGTDSLRDKVAAARDAVVGVPAPAPSAPASAGDAGDGASDEYYAAKENGPAEPSTDFHTVAAVLANGLPQVHLLRLPFDTTRSAMAWTNYFASLDVERMVFSQEDLARFEPHRLNLRDEMLAGNIDFAKEAYDLYLQRLRERNESIHALLETPMDFSVEESYVWRRRESPWPKDSAERDELWRLRIKNELLAKILNKVLDEEEAAKAPAAEKDNGEEETKDAEAAGKDEEDGEKDASVDGREPDTPEAFVRKRYDKFLEFMEDSDSDFYLSKYFDALTGAYDPHTNYMSPITQEDFDIHMQLSLQGIGATLQTEEGTAKITEIIPGGPADRDTRDIRLVPGDRIIAVAQGDGEFVDILHWPLSKAVRKIRGDKGTTVRLLVQCADDPTHEKTKVVDLVRDEVKLEEQAATSTLEVITDEKGAERRFGVIDLPTFYNGGGDGATPRSCSADIAKLLLDLDDIEGLVLDLRSNGGGALREAVDLAGLFIRSGPVVQVKERNRIQSLKDFNPSVAFRKPLVVLIDRLSASASEIVAGALQDYGRAIIIGDSTTHGKGTVQQVLPLDDGKLGSLKVTNASFYRITGDSTQLRGVFSDILLPSVFDFYSELGEDKLPNAIPWSHIRPDQYEKVADLRPAIAELNRRSMRRRVTDERWQAHERRLAAVKTINERDSVPLEREKRLAQMREERELLKLDEEEDAILGAPSSDNDDEKEPMTRAEREAARRAQDVVLDEALRILADFVDYQAEHPLEISAPRGKSDPKSLEDIFKVFFQ